jgi:hypothetical protein
MMMMILIFSVAIFVPILVNGMSGMGFNNLDAWPGSGVNNGRIWDIGVHWGAIHLGPDQYNWATLDAVMGQYGSFGIQVTYVIGGTPQWLAKYPDQPYYAPWLGPGSNSMPYDLDEFNKFVAALASRYNGRIQAFEIWNEPQLNDFLYPYTDAELNCLAKMTQMAHSTIKSISPGAKVLGAAVLPRESSGGMKKAESYLKAMQKKGWNVDVFTVHIYPNIGEGPAQWSSYLQDCRNTLAAMGAPSLPLWVTETNYNLMGPVIPEADAPSYVNPTYDEAAKQGVTMIFWYTWNKASEIGGLLFTQTSSAWAAVAAH